MHTEKHLCFRRLIVRQNCLEAFAWLVEHECTVITKKSLLDEAVEGLCFSTQPPKVKDEPSLRKPTFTSSSMFSTACHRMQVKNKLKRTGARTQPCLTPLEIVKGSDWSPLESRIMEKADDLIELGVGRWGQP